MLDFLLGPLASAANDPYFYVLLPFLWMLMRHLSRAPTTTEQMEREQAWLTHTCRELHLDAPGYVREYLNGELESWDFADAIAALPAREKPTAAADHQPLTEKDRAIALAVLRAKQQQRAIQRGRSARGSKRYNTREEMAILDAAMLRQYNQPLRSGPTNAAAPIIIDNYFEYVPPPITEFENMEAEQHDYR